MAHDNYPKSNDQLVQDLLNNQEIQRLFGDQTHVKEDAAEKVNSLMTITGNYMEATGNIHRGMSDQQVAEEVRTIAKQVAAYFRQLHEFEQSQR